MRIEEWLDRLNLIEFMHIFVKNKVFTVNDLSNHCQDGNFGEGFDFGKFEQQKQRLSLMARGDKNAISGFEYKSVQGCRQILQKFIKNKLIREKLIRYVNEESLTGYQIQDILRDNLTYEAIRDQLIVRQMQNRSRLSNLKDPRVIAANLKARGSYTFKKDETEEEKKKRHGCPEDDIEALLSSFGVEDIQKKMQDKHIDKEIFWEMGEEDLGAQFDIKKFGTKRRLHMKMQELIEAHSKKMTQKDKDAKKLSEVEKQHLKALASCYCGEDHEAHDHDDDDDSDVDSVPLIISRTLSVLPQMVKTKSRY